jgi:hypothetical protein
MTNEIARKVIAAFREPSPEPDAGEALAPREREILDLAAQGYANKGLPINSHSAWARSVGIFSRSIGSGMCRAARRP